MHVRWYMQKELTEEVASVLVDAVYINATLDPVATGVRPVPLNTIEKIFSVFHANAG
jgi:hypothetical protein